MQKFEDCCVFIAHESKLLKDIYQIAIATQSFLI